MTLYRLVIKGTVEERILQRAEEKSKVGVALVSCDANCVVYTVTIGTKILDGNYWRSFQTRSRLTEAKRSSITSTCMMMKKWRQDVSIMSLLLE